MRLALALPVVVVVLFAAPVAAQDQEVCTRATAATQLDVQLCMQPVGAGAVPATRDVVVFVKVEGEAPPGLQLTDAAIDGVAAAAAASLSPYAFSIEGTAASVHYPWNGVAVTFTLVDGGAAVVAAVTAVPVVAFSRFADATPTFGGLGQRFQAGMCHSGQHVMVVASQKLYVYAIAAGTGELALAQADPAADSLQAVRCVMVDLDADGDLDVLLPATDTASPNDVVRQRADGLFAQHLLPGNDPLATPSISVRDVAVGDVDGDGDTDLAFCAADVPSVLLRQTGAGFETAPASDLPAFTNCVAMVLADLDGDAHLDVLSALGGAGVALSLNVNGTGVFVDGTAAAGLTRAALPECYTVAVGDVDNNGGLDLLCTPSGGTAPFLMMNNGAGAFDDQTAARGMPSTFHRIVAAWDVDLDGDLDVAFLGPNNWLLSVNDGAGGFADGATALAFDVSTGSGPSPFGVWDLDGSGDQEVIVGAQVLAARMPAAVTKHLGVRPLLPSALPAAHGATVRVACVSAACAGWSALRVVGATPTQYDAHVGVPDPSAAYNVTVRWPGDAFPAATWVSHPGLGGVVPDGLQPQRRVLVVRPVGTPVLFRAQWRPVPFELEFDASATPANITLAPLGAATDVAVVGNSVAVNGEAVAVTRLASGVSVGFFAAPPANSTWPRAGLTVTGTGVDALGFTLPIHLEYVPGMQFLSLPRVADAPVSREPALCVGDVNNDGLYDALQALDVAVGPHVLYLATAVDVFTQAQDAWGVAGNGLQQPTSCVFGDLDGDGDVDLLIAHGGAQTELYVNRDATTFSPPVGFLQDSEARLVALGDVDGDTRLDLVVARLPTGKELFLQHPHDGTFAQAATPSFAARAAHAFALADVNGDGHLDLLVANGAGGDSGNELQLGDGTGAFTDASAARGFAHTGDCRALSVADVTNDGVVDVVVACADAFRVLALVNDGSGYFEDRAHELGLRGAPSEAPPPATLGAGVLDLELDGDLDVVVAAAGQPVALFRNDGAAFTDVAAAYGLQSLPNPAEVSAVVIAATTTGCSSDAFLLSGNFWLRSSACRAEVPRYFVVRVLTAAGARSSPGSTVRVECVARCSRPWATARVVHGGGNGGSQDAPDVAVGVPEPDAVYNVTVSWPAHPRASWATHAGLGGIVPALLPEDGRLLWVRPPDAPAQYRLVPPALPTAAPLSGTPVTVVLEPVVPTVDVVLRGNWDVNGAAVTPAAVAGGAFRAVYSTAASDVQWPWTGLRVSATLVDSAGLPVVVQDSVVVGVRPTHSVGLLSPGQSGVRGMCVGDIDGNGVEDAVETFSLGDSRVWLMTASGATDSSGTYDVGTGSVGHTAYGCVLADLNNDGQLDVVAPRSSLIVAFMLAPNAGSAEATLRSGPIANVRGVSVGDLDGNGALDVFATFFGVANELYTGTHIPGEFSPDAAVAWQVASTRFATSSLLVDVDGDAWLDVLVVNANAQANELYLNAAPSLTTTGDVAADRGFALPGGSAQALAAFDFDGSGTVDVYVAHSDAADALLSNDGAGVFTDVSAASGVTAATLTLVSNSVGVWDMDRDGDLDLLVAPPLTSNGRVVALRNVGGGLVEDVSAEANFPSSGGAMTSMVTWDADGDGDEDALVAHAALFARSTNTVPAVLRHIVVRALTQESAPSAVGAVIRVACVAGCGRPDWLAMRIVSGGGSVRSQSGGDAVVQLPWLDAAYNVTVAWPAARHAPATWVTHTRLGGIVPSQLTGAASRRFQVRPVSGAPTVSVVPIPPLPPAATPAAGDEVDVHIDTTPFPLLPDQALEVRVDGVLRSAAQHLDGNYVVSLTTTATDWPWRGLHVAVQVVDSAGLTTLVSTTRTPGMAMTPSTSDNRGDVGGTPAVNSMCVSDFDADGDTDVAVMYFSDALQLWRNDGAAGFANVASDWGVDLASTSAMSCAWGDVYGGDGHMDLLVGTVNGAANLVFGQKPGDGGFVDVTAAVGLDGVTDRASGVLLADVNGDRQVDVLFLPSAENNARLFVSADGPNSTFQDAWTVFSPIPSPASGHVLALFVDVNADDHVDVVYAASTGTASGVLTNQAGVALMSIPPATLAGGASATGLAAVDVNGDGFPDIVVASDNQQLRVFDNDGTGLLTERLVTNPSPTQLGDPTAGIVALDLLLDGSLALVVPHSQAAHQAWVAYDPGVFTEVASSVGVADTASAGVSVNGGVAADFDGDGDEDVLIPGNQRLYLNNNARPGAVRSLAIRPLSAAGAPTVFGAAVHVVCVTCASPWRALRVIDGGGSGARDQGGYDAVVGVPDPSASYNITVRWPGAVLVADWASHQRLGGVVPASLTAATRLLIVRTPSALPRLTLDPVPAVGHDPYPAAAEVTVVLHASPPDLAPDQTVAGWLDGQPADVVAVGGGTFRLSTAPETAAWPWAGLHVVATVQDSAGLQATTSATLYAGAALQVDARSGRPTPPVVVPDEVQGVCVADVDGNGAPDVVVVSSTPGEPHQLWLQADDASAGAFTDAAPDWGFNHTVSASACVVADVDNDGRLDVFVPPHASTSHAELFVQRPPGATGGGFTPSAATWGVAHVTGPVPCSAVGDVDGDGWTDVYMPAVGLFVNAHNTLVAATATTGLPPPSAGVVAVALADLDNTGSLDVVVLAPAAVYINDASGGFEQLPFGHAGAATSLAVVDMNADGWLDIVLGGAPDVPPALYTGDGAGALAASAALAGIDDAPPTSHAVVAWDLQLDGFVDVVLAGDGPRAAVWQRGAVHDFTDASQLVGWSSPPSPPTGASAVDLDGDGDEDLLVAGASLAYINHNARLGYTAWVRVRPTTAAGASVVPGAVVRAVCVARCDGAWAAARSVSGGGARGGPHPAADVVLGLPAAAGAYNITVVWPGGRLPAATWASHPALGGYVPTARAAAIDRLVVVRPAAVPVRVGVIQSPFTTPPVDHTHLVPLLIPAGDVRVVSAVVDGMDVAHTFAPGDAPGTYTIEFRTIAGSQQWPRGPLPVAVTVVDSAGLTSSVAAAPVVGITPSVDDRVAPAHTVCVGDIDASGSADLFSPGLSPFPLLLNDGGAAFEGDEETWGVQGSSLSGRGCAFADVNGDGHVDLLVAAGAGVPSELWLSAPTGEPPLVEAGAAAGVAAPAADTLSVAVGDVDGDGDPDVLWCHADAPPAALLNANSTGEFAAGGGSHAAVPVPGGACSQAVLVDVTGDAVLDVVMVTPAAGVVVCVGSGARGGAPLWPSCATVLSRTALAVAVGDVTGTHALDLVVTRPSTAAPLVLLVGVGDGTFVDETVARGMVPASPAATPFAGVALWDANFDGAPDVYSPALYFEYSPATAAFRQAGAKRGLSFTPPSQSGAVAVADVNADGTPDAVVAAAGGGLVYRSVNAEPASPKWVTVQPQSSLRAASASSTLVRLSCASCPAAWQAVQAVVPPHTPAAAHFVVPVTNASYSVHVTFPGGAAHSSATQAALGSVRAGDTVAVPNLPYVHSQDVTPRVADTPWVGIGANVTVTLVAGGRATDLRPAPSPLCCFINDVDVTPSFAHQGDGVYTLSYTVAEGDALWAWGALSVTATLRSALGVEAEPRPLPLARSPGGDATPPVVAAPCRSDVAVSRLAAEPLCVWCSNEEHADGSCTYFVSVGVAADAHTTPAMSPPSKPAGGLPGVGADRPFTADLGPFADADHVTVAVHAVDAAGNVGPAVSRRWRVDLTPPETTIDSMSVTDGGVSGQTDATFALSCSEVPCTFGYRLNGDAAVWLRASDGNDADAAAAAAAAALAVDTVVVDAPPRFTPSSSPVLRFAAAAGGVDDLVNATVTVSLDGSRRWTLDVPPGDNTTDPLRLPALPDGVYAATARATTGSGLQDSTPAVYTFEVDTTAPAVLLHKAPSVASDLLVVGASEPGCTFRWRAGPTAAVPAAPWNASAVGVIRVPLPAPGSAVEHTVEAYAVDAAGLASEVVSATWAATACPATVPDVQVGAALQVGVGAAAFLLRPVGTVTWPLYEYAVGDAGGWVQTEEPVLVVPAVAPGAAYTLKARAGVSEACRGTAAVANRRATAVVWTAPSQGPLDAWFTLEPPPSTSAPFVGFEVATTEAEGGVFLRHRVNDGPWAPCSRQLRLGPMPAGTYTVEAQATDADGGGSGAAATYTWTVTSETDSAVVLTDLADRQHAIELLARDEAGNVEPTPQAVTWRIDTIRPDTVANRTSPAASAQRTVVVDVECLGEADACEFCWESASLQPATGCTANTTLELTAVLDGDHTLAVAAVDSGGLRDDTPAEVVWTADATPPNTTAVEAGSLLVPRGDGTLATTAAAITWTLGANEPVAGFQVAVNGVPRAAAVPGPDVAVPLPDGTSVVWFAAVDLANNVDPVGVTFVVDVDASPPVSTLAVPPSPRAAPNITATITAADGNGTGVVDVAVELRRWPSGVVADARLLTALTPEPSLPGGGAATVTFTDLTSGTYSVTVTAQDAAGNVAAAPANASVVVDVKPPTSELKPPLPPAVSPSSTLVVGVVADEPVSATYARLVRGSPAVVGEWRPADAAGYVTFTDVADGAVRLQVHSVDVAGGVELPPFATAPVTVDTLRPVAAWVAPPLEFTADATVTLCVAAVDNTTVAFDAAATTPGTASAVVQPAPTPPSPPLPRNSACVVVAAAGAAGADVGVRVTATDAAGNALVAPVEAQWVWDDVAPVTTVHATVADAVGCFTPRRAGAVTVCNSTAAATVRTTCVSGGGVSNTPHAPCARQHGVQTLDVASNCGAGGAVARLLRRLSGDDGGEGAPVFVASPPDTGAPFPVLGADAVDGRYRVALRSVDAAGNEEAAAAATMEWHLDTTPVTARPTLLEVPPLSTSSTGAQFRLQLTDDASPGQTALWFAVDGVPPALLPEQPVAANGDEVPLRFADGHFAAGSHSISFWGVDQAGHVGPPAVYDWTVVSFAPAVEVVAHPVRVSADPGPEFRVAVYWPPGYPAANATAWEAAVEVSLGDGFQVACTGVVATAGVCAWSEPLDAPKVYTFSARAVLAGVNGDPQTVTWEYKTCEGDEQYAEVDAATQAVACRTCPPGANCGGSLTAQSDLVALPGWWAPPGASGLRFYSCPTPEACLPGGAVTLADNTTGLVLARCAAGYTGTLCGVCADGYFEQFGRCAACDAESGVAWLITAAVVAALVACGVLFFKFRELLPVDQLKVTLSMAQIIASGNTAYAIPWPTMFADFLNVMRVFLIEAVSMTRASCAQPMTFYTSLVVTLVGFKVVLLLVVFTPVLIHKWHHRHGHVMPPSQLLAPPAAAGRRLSRSAASAAAIEAAVTTASGRDGDAQAGQQRAPARRRRRRRSTIAALVVAAAHRAVAVDWAKVFKITFLFLFVAYPGVSLRVMKMFKCVEVEGTQWLVADMRLRCYEGEWFGYALYAGIMGCLYTLGLPAAITVILVRNRRRLRHTSVVDRWGFLYTPYGTHAYLWEAVELVRKFLLSAFVVLLAEGSPLQVTFAVLVSGWAHVAHAVWKPWRSAGADGDGDYTYALQHVSLGVTAFVFLMGLLFKVDGVRHGGNTYDFLAWAMVVACVAFLAAAAALLVRTSLMKVRLLRRRSAMKAAAKTGPHGAVLRRGGVVSARHARTQRMSTSSRTGGHGDGGGSGGSGDGSAPSLGMAWQSNPTFNGSRRLGRRTRSALHTRAAKATPTSP